MRRVELALVLRLLPQEPKGGRDLRLDPVPQPKVGDGAQLALDIAQDPAGIAREPPQALLHPPELTGMGMTPDLSGQTRRQPGMALPQRQARFPGKRHQAPARLLVEPCVGRMRDRLRHDRRVHDHRLHAPL